MLVYTSVLFVLGNTGPVPATERAREEVGDFADAMCLDQRVAAPRAASLGWQPRWPAFSEAVTRAYTEWIDAGGES